MQSMSIWKPLMVYPLVWQVLFPFATIANCLAFLQSVLSNLISKSYLLYERELLHCEKLTLNAIIFGLKNVALYLKFAASNLFSAVSFFLFSIRDTIFNHRFVFNSPSLTAAINAVITSFDSPFAGIKINFRRAFSDGFHYQMITKKCWASPNFHCFYL